MENYSETTLRDYLRIIFRHIVVVLTAIITVTATVIVGLIFKTPVYQSQVKMLVSAEKQVEATYYRELLLDRNTPITITQSEIMKSNPVMERVVKAIGLYQRPLDYEKNFCSLIKKPYVILSAKAFNAKLKHLPEDQRRAFLYRIAVEDLKQHVDVEPIRDTNLFILSARDFSPVGAAIIANVVSRSYVIFDLEQQMAEQQLKYGEKHQSVIQLKDNIERMIKNLDGKPLPDVEAIGPASVKIIEQATVPLRPVGLPKSTTLLLAFVMSVFLGVMLAFTCEYLDQTFKSAVEVERYLNLPFLGFIPRRLKKHKSSIVNTKREAMLARAYNNLSEQIYLIMRDRNFKSLLLTSALRLEGVSTIAHNMGMYLSNSAGHKVLIIDANLRNTTSVGVKAKTLKGPGLTDVIEGKVTFEKAVHALNAKFHVLSAGETELNPITFFDSVAMQDLIKHVKEKYEIVLIDCSDLISFKDAAVLSAYVDGTVLVVNENKTRRQVVKAAIVPLEQKKANILGVILNNRTFPIPEKIYQRI
ncbi:MAG: polysaccharide biosynthesis tyrosine autokinase [Candidatus Omnitrophica bacterium]|nr:polysaccharide biosynthesis tyrosine autokinase [Candidatus Omnitrophota bacterium]